MSDLVRATFDADFDAEVLQSDIPVLVDFWAPWCGPCKMIGPVLEEIAKTYEGRLKVVKMDVDQNTQVPAQHNVRGIPFLMLVKSGAVVDTKVGALAKSQLVEFIDTNI